MECSKGCVRKEQRAEVGMVEQGHSWFSPPSRCRCLNSANGVSQPGHHSGKKKWEENLECERLQEKN